MSAPKCPDARLCYLRDGPRALDTEHWYCTGCGKDVRDILVPGTQVVYVEREARGIESERDRLMHPDNVFGFVVGVTQVTYGATAFIRVWSPGMRTIAKASRGYSRPVNVKYLHPLELVPQERVERALENIKRHNGVWRVEILPVALRRAIGGGG